MYNCIHYSIQCRDFKWQDLKSRGSGFKSPFYHLPLWPAQTSYSNFPVPGFLKWSKCKTDIMILILCKNTERGGELGQVERLAPQLVHRKYLVNVGYFYLYNIEYLSFFTFFVMQSKCIYFIVFLFFFHFYLYIFFFRISYKLLFSNFLSLMLNSVTFIPAGLKMKASTTLNLLLITALSGSFRVAMQYWIHL